MPQRREKELWELSAGEVLERLETSEKGLKAYEVEKRRAAYGKNEIKERHRHPSWWLFFQQFRSALVIILIVASVVSAALGEIFDAAVIFAIVLLNSGLGFAQENKAEKALEALKKLAAPKAKAMRDGRVVEVPASELVPGDIVLLEMGDKVPADCRVIEELNLKVDESPLTGESTPVAKTAGALQGAGIPVAERGNMVFGGTTVVYGHCKVAVASIGMATEFGKIAEALAVPEERTPLQHRLDQLGRQLGLLGVAGLIFLAGVGAGLEPLSMFLVAVALAVAAIPEGLPAVVTITLANGVQRMARRNAIVRRLGAVETLGSATVICSDKTGTMTVNEMTVRKLYTHDKVFDVTGEGYSVQGEFYLDGRKMNIAKLEDVKLMLASGMFCNDVIAGENMVGDPTEAALYVSARKAGFEDLRQSYKRVDEIPFDSRRKMMTVMHEVGARRMIYSKGAVEEILRRSTHMLKAGKIVRMTRRDKGKVLQANREFAQNALRVLAFAVKKGNKKMKITESGLVFVGLQGMSDPPRPEVKEALAKCKKAGINVVMITGDHRETAVAVSKELGLIESEDGSVLTGVELDKLSDSEFAARAENIRVYARVAPEHKVRITEALKAKGHIVAMTGDGINDAPAVKAANIGIAMGQTGTDVTREAADIVLSDDNFATIVSAVEEGRGIFDNIQKFIRYLLSANSGEVMALTAAMFIGIALGLPAGALILLLPVQILWMNLITDGLPALALGVESAEPDAMLKKPRNPKAPILTRSSAIWILSVGLAMAIGTLAAYFWFLATPTLGQSTAFTMLVILEMVVALASRSSKPIAKAGFNAKLLLAVAVSVLLQVAVVYLPFAQPVFGTVPLGYTEWIAVAAAAAALFAALEAAKWLRARPKAPKKLEVVAAGFEEVQA
jgi:Ca2+-transporting ATPase